MTLLKAEDLKKYYPIYKGFLRKPAGEVKALDGVSFTLQDKEILGIVGESGSGKTTLGRIIAGLTKPTSGRVDYSGKKLDIQMIFQDPGAALNPRYPIGEALAEPLIYHKKCASLDDAYDKAGGILELIGLERDVMGRYPHQFSLGQKQRIAIGRALILDPRIIICDEPVSSLDISIQAQILNLILELRDKKGIAFLFITHDLNIVHYIADNLLVMHKGKCVEQGETKNIFDNPQDPYTQKLLSAIPGKEYFARNSLL